MQKDDIEDTIIKNLWPDYLYSHEFEDGRFFQIVHHETKADENSVIIKIASKTLLKVVLLKKKNSIEGLEIIKLVHGDQKQKIKLSKFNIAQIKVFLSFISKIDLKGIEEKKLRLHEDSDYSKEDLISKLTDLLGPALSSDIFEKYLDQGLFLAKDLVNTGYRKLQLTKFRALLEESDFWRTYCLEAQIKVHSEEKAWQHFFEVNQWIFGYGLDYRFKSILQREVHLSASEVDGSNSVIADYLLGDKMFTTFVEIKKPTTPIFSSEKNRSNSWRISNDLIYAVSQVLEQKAAGLVKFDKQQFISGNFVKQKTYDSKVILIIGHWNELNIAKNDLEKEIKKKTFELFRRDSKNLEILTFDELFERATFIVKGSPDIDDVIDDDDLPF